MEKIANKFDLPDQCRSYKQLTSSKRRFDAPNSRSNVNCDKSGHSKQQEDWQGEGFYRIEGGAGTKLSENCSSYKYGNCGTHLGFHLMGGHPATPGQTVDRKATNYGCIDSSNDDVYIQVTNCGTYFVYNLKELRRCDLGYCTE